MTIDAKQKIFFATCFDQEWRKCYYESWNLVVGRLLTYSPNYTKALTHAYMDFAHNRLYMHACAHTLKSYNHTW